jgi:HlyD family secretion protein
MKKKIIWGIIIVMIVTGGYFLLRPKAPMTVYTTEAVTRGNLAQTVSETGTIKTVNQTDLSFKISGRVTNLYADVGDTIKQGQLLARLDLGTLGAQLAQARSEVKVQQETLDNMVKHKLLTSSTGDTRDAQRARLTQAKDGVSSVFSQIRDTYMYSPIDGVILKRNVDPFETTVANSPTPVFTVGNPGDLVIETNVPESDITKVKISQTANITFDALSPDQIFPGKVMEIDPASTVIQDVVYYRIKLKLDNLDPAIKAGMTANIDVHTAEAGNVLMIPLRAVQTEGTQKYVQVLTDEKTNTVTRKNITTGLEGDEGMVEVASGLNVGDKVVTFTKTQ